MKKFIAVVIIALCMQTTVFAAVADVTYTYDEEYIQKLGTGLEYHGYSGKIDFSVTETNPDEVGVKLSVDRIYHVPFEIPFVGHLSSGNFSMRIGGRGLVYGDYTATPYYVKDGVKIYGESVNFTISETCVAMTNLRIAYDQINILTEKGIFTADEQKIVDYIMTVAKEVIEDGENGTAITKEYVSANYRTECATVKAMYDSLGDDPSTPDKQEGSMTRIAFAKKFNEPNVEKVARVYLMTEFELMRFI